MREAKLKLDNMCDGVSEGVTFANIAQAIAFQRFEGAGNLNSVLKCVLCGHQDSRHIIRCSAMKEQYANLVLPHCGDLSIEQMWEAC